MALVIGHLKDGLSGLGSEAKTDRSASVFVRHALLSEHIWLQIAGRDGPWEQFLIEEEQNVLVA